MTCYVDVSKGDFRRQGVAQGATALVCRSLSDGKFGKGGRSQAGEAGRLKGAS